MRDQQDRAMITAKLTIRSLTLSYVNTGYFQVEVTPHSKDQNPSVNTHTFSGVAIGQSTIGQQTLLTGEITYEIAANSKDVQIDIVTDSFLPCQIQIAAWEANFNIRSKHR